MTATVRVADILTPQSISRITTTVAKQLIHDRIGSFSMDDALGWAQLGVVQAMSEFSLERFTDDTVVSLEARTASYLETTGFYRTIDHLRNAGQIGRVRYGQLYPARCVKHTLLGDYDLGVPDEPKITGHDLAVVTEMREFVQDILGGHAATLFTMLFVRGLTNMEAAVELRVTSANIYARRKKMVALLQAQYGEVAVAE